MDLHDSVDYAVSGATPEALTTFETAAHELRCYIGDPVASVDRALGSSGDMTMAHALKAYLHLLGTEPAALAVARECHAAASRCAANERERLHLAAVGLLLQGRWREAGRTLEDLSARYPRDALALQAGHLIDFYTGDARMLRDRIARVLPAWDASLPGYHAVLGMYAFGLEECGDYAKAERYGRESVERERRDGWGWHAVTHALEMTQRPRDGIAWLGADTAAWSADSFFAIHNWWHLALYHLELDQVDEALRLFDEPIYGKRSPVVLDMIDASALLWRLHLRGVELGERWSALAENWAAVATASNYAFNDAHAMMAFVGSGASERQRALLEAQREAMRASGDNAVFLAEVGHAVTLAIQAFGDGDYARCVSLLRPIRSHAHRFGGSHAQRDVIDLTLVEAAFRAGDAALGRALAAERVALRPQSPLALRYAGRSAASASKPPGSAN